MKAELQISQRDKELPDGPVSAQALRQTPTCSTGAPWCGAMGKVKQKQKICYEKSVIFICIENPFNPKMVNLDKMSKLNAT